MPEAILPGSPLTNDIPNAAYPTAGLGLVLGTNGLMDPSTLATGVRTGTKFLRDDQTWQPAGSTTYRKTTTKAVNTTVGATDLLNGEITVAAGVLGTTGLLRLTAWGDFLQNSGGAAAPPRIQLVFGGTTLLDSGTSGSVTNGATRTGWRIVVEILNSAANAQTASIAGRFGGLLFTANPSSAFTTGEGGYSVINQTGTQGIADMNGVQPTGAVNTAVSTSLVLNAINGSASASYETKLFGALVEII